MTEQNATQESAKQENWVNQFNEALEHVDRAHFILSQLHEEVDTAADNYNPVGIDDAETNLAILRITAEDLEKLRDDTEVSELKSKLQMEEEELKDNLEWIQAGHHNDGRPKPVVKLERQPDSAGILSHGANALEAAGRVNELPKLRAELEITQDSDERLRIARRWFHVLMDEPQHV